MFTHYKIDTAQINAELAAAAARFEEIAPGGDFPAHAALVIATRLRERPHVYLEFGPYWWAVKDTLRAQGFEFGPADDEVVRPHYSPLLEERGATLVAGELFKDYYRRTFLTGSAQFWLDGGEEESYVLFDPDMEARRLGKAGLLVSANLGAQELESEPEAAPEQ